MNPPLTLVFGLLLWMAGVDGAFRDFVVGPEDDLEDNALQTDGLQQDPEDYHDEDVLVSFQSVEHDGLVDTELLLKALMQHAQRLGLSLDELANMRYAVEEDNEDNQLDQDMLGCNARDQEYAQRPTWRDVLFN
ncbi:uncharacterized protein LOC111075898 [Drosophila obscura]|uniref:uncharacterized protein LOC111075898 n=1 Tax=Drosophila obscura TaxID=7282 RepID=UPI001BB12A03|nr:uncharacterized protein LOC111075898 [Drosophila obscura]